MRLLPVVIALLLSTQIAPAQTDSNASQISPAADASALHEYESCTFQDGLQIVKIDSLPPGIQQRTINTAQGTKTIHMLAGRRIMFAYGVGGDLFANVKPEVLPDGSWASEKQSLLDEIAAMQSVRSTRQRCALSFAFCTSISSRACFQSLSLHLRSS